MLLKVERFHSTNDETYSLVTVDDMFTCFGLEDEPRVNKVVGETRIPAGLYPVKVRTHGGFHNRYSVKFDFHKGMLEVCNVPNFTDILLHIGNTDEDTMGCLLLGSSCDPTKHMVGKSTLAYERVYRSVIDAALDGELMIEYIDNDMLHIPEHIRLLL